MADWYVSSAAWTAIAQFAVSGVYTVGQIVRPLTAPSFNAQHAFRCTTAGTAGAEPSWISAASNNNTVTTGGATFTNVSGQSTYGWSAPSGNIYAISSNGAGGSRVVVGDRMFLSSDHTETPTTPIYQIPNSASYGVIQLISVNRAGSVPPVAADALSGAAIVATNSLTLDNLCNLLWQGVTITLGGAGGNITFGNSNYKTHYFRNCAFVFTTSTTNAFLGTNNPTKVTFDNTTVSFNNAGQHFAPSSYPFDFLWINTPAAIPGTVPTILFNSSTNLMGTFTCRGVDFSAVNTTLCYGSGGSNATKALFDSCRINSAVVRLGTAAYANSSDEIELVNCYDGTNFLAERHTPAGDVTTEFTITLTGGAQDNVGTFSHKMISSARSDMYAMPLEGFWMDVNNTLIGSARTATVEIISSASLNNNDITLLLEYEGTSGSSLASFVSSLASPLTATAAVPTSTATWNSSPATPVKQHLQVTFTPLVAGRVRGLVRLGKVSTTVYVNPVITIT